MGITRINSQVWVSRSSTRANPKTSPTSEQAAMMMNGATYTSMCSMGTHRSTIRAATAIRSVYAVIMTRNPSR